MKIIHKLSAPRRCNCVFWALNRFFTRPSNKRGYLAIRISFFSPTLVHVFWSSNLKTWWGYTALPGMLTSGYWWQAIWFEGHVVMGDADAVAAHAKAMMDKKDLSIILG